MTTPRWEHILGVALDQLEERPGDLDRARDTLRQLRGVAAVSVEIARPWIDWRGGARFGQPAWSVGTDERGNVLWIRRSRDDGPHLVERSGTMRFVEHYDKHGDPMGRVRFDVGGVMVLEAPGGDIRSAPPRPMLIDRRGTRPLPEGR